MLGPALGDTGDTATLKGVNNDIGSTKKRCLARDALLAAAAELPAGHAVLVYPSGAPARLQELRAERGGKSGFWTGAAQEH